MRLAFRVWRNFCLKGARDRPHSEDRCCAALRVNQAAARVNIRGLGPRIWDSEKKQQKSLRTLHWAIPFSARPAFGKVLHCVHLRAIWNQAGA